MSADDRIEIRGLIVSAICGVLPEEKGRTQPFRIDIDLHVDLSEASQSDALNDTVDYGAVTFQVQKIADEANFDLMERFAGVIAEMALDYQGVDAVTVTITKLRPPLPELVDTTGVRIHRTSLGA
jgi:dihydroneopterin aldolase